VSEFNPAYAGAGIAVPSGDTHVWALHWETCTWPIQAALQMCHVCKRLKIPLSVKVIDLCIFPASYT